MPLEHTALVTGASRGIGRACARELAAAGWTVVATYRSGADEAAELAADIRAAGGEAIARRADVSDEADTRELFRWIRAECPPLNVVVANAGITRDAFAPMMSLQTWDEVIGVNLTGAFLVARESLKAMRKSGGSLVFVSSVSGLRGQPGQANYSASKGGLNALTRTLAREAAPSGIRVNAVAPGFTDTDMVRQIPRAAREQAMEHIPLGRLAEPREVATAVRFLAGDDSSYITGQILTVDGGLTA
ncbi:3-oxoacyl-ACP reductase FabG [Leifsonia sp. McL0607]|uniref:3-oxoacyl-ACP reductase FabG n=1 Tax=Leifsonia sp. McL0607 TaxID=3415672 RepID=UPI003CEF63B7